MSTALEITIFSLLMATISLILMLPAGVGLGWLLARRRFVGHSLVETLVTMPLVLPPVAVGLVLLKIFGRRGLLGGTLADAGLEIIFTWKAVVLAMTVMGLPLLVRTARAGFQNVDRRYEHVAATLGARPLRVFFTITLPLASRPVAAGALLAFTRALGEFGATVMVAGSLPGGTATLGVAIYTLTETGQDAAAAILVALASLVAFSAVLISNRLLHD